jgi:hypothetical protein
MEQVKVVGNSASPYQDCASSPFDLRLEGSTMLRKPIAYLLGVAYLANVGCANVPFPVPSAIEDVARDAAIRQVAAIWKDDIPIQRTEHTLYPTVERLPGAAFRVRGSNATKIYGEAHCQGETVPNDH